MRHRIDSLGRVLLSAASSVPFVALPLGGALADTQSREVGPFSEIRMDGPGIVEIGVGERETLAVEATAELMAHIITTVDDHTLVISYDRAFADLWRRADTPKFHITLPRLEAIDADGGGKLSI